MSRTVTSQLKFYCQAFVIAGSFAFLFAGSVAHAQSGKRASRGTVNRVPQGSTNRATASTGLALKGYCPVCIVEMKKWVKGAPTIHATYDGKAYYFPGNEQRDMFLADPAKYVPALGGDCTVCLAKMGKRVQGSIRHAAMSNRRLFLFPSKDQQQEFLANSSHYVDVDLAYQGKCVVCRVEMNKDVPGKPEVAAYYQGMRYLFPAEQQRGMFLANPAKYVATPTPSTQTFSGTATEKLVNVTGKSGCAGCDHGVSPIGAPDELGLAVNAADGKVYVVENAHKLFPKVYEERFAGLPLEVSGKVLKRAGKVTWIEPKGLKILN